MEIETSSPARLDMREVACSRGGRLLFEGLNVTLEAGGALSVRGPNGSGKSSLLRLVAGLLELAGGEILWQGGFETLPSAARFHYCGHSDGLKPALTVAEHIRFWRRLMRGMPGAEPAAMAAAELGTVADLPAAFLSAGQRKRLALARLTLAYRPLWLLDEPGNALDAAALAALERHIAGHRSQGGMVVVAGHGDWRLPGAASLRLGERVAA